jgi:DNA-binding LacI/PurR family transcriptional regulator
VLLDSTESAKAEAECLERARHAGVDGVIVYPADGFRSTAHFERLRADGVPLVLVDRYYPGLATDVVMPDHVAVGACVTEHLIAQGHRCLATAWSDEVQCTAVHERLIGHKQALRAHGLPIDAELTALRPYSAQPAERRRQILSGWLERPNPPTAVIAVHSEVLAVVISDLAALGVQVGEEIALACMDSIDAEGLPTLAVAGVTVPSYEMGVRAMQVLLGRVRGAAAPPEQVLLPVDLAVSRALPLAGTQLRTVRMGDGRGSDRELVAERR